MFAYRQRGLVTLHSAIVCVVVTATLPIFALLTPSLPFLNLSEDVDLLPYCVAVFLATAVSTSTIRRRESELHRLGSMDALALAGRQLVYVAGVIFAVVFSLKDTHISRLFLGLYLVITFVLLAYLHANLPPWLARMFFPERNDLTTLLVGSADSLEDLDAWISSRGHIGIRPVGSLSDEAPTRGGRAVAPYLGKLERLAEVLAKQPVSQVILLDWNQPNEIIEGIVETCEKAGVRFLIHNNYTARFARVMTPVEEGGRHFLVMQTAPLEDPVNRAAKRLLDIAVSLPVCLLILPLCMVVWVMQQKQAPGPLFFNRPRGGMGRRPFNMFKFRSMYAAEHDINKQATAGDARVFTFGKIMRKMSIDEFPQFFNVLRGDMSVVGPRLHLPQHDDEFSQITRSYHGRAFAKPGITGMAQVRGYRGEITEPHNLQRRIYWDLYYMARWSLWLDLRIIVTTAWHVISPPQSAY